MKSLLLLLAFFLSIFSVQAHTLGYENTLPRHWKLNTSQTEVLGYLLMVKNNRVAIETPNHTIMHIPMVDFSKPDQQYIEARYAKIKAQNPNTVSTSSTNHLFTTKTVAILIALLLGGFLVYKIPVPSMKKFAYPILGSGVLFTLFSFGAHEMKLRQLTTSLGFLDSTFAPFTPNVHTFSDSNYYYVESQGIPATHGMMVGISNHGWQQQVPIPQCYLGNNAWPIPLHPVLATNPIPVDTIHFTRGAIAIAANGVPIFNVHTNTGVDSYIDGQLDDFGGHCGRADDYHYHIAPLHLYNYTLPSLPIAMALDGFAVYGSVEPDGSAMQALDANHGHTSSTGGYHYHGTTTAPYMIARMAGEVTEDATHQLIPQAAAQPVRPGLTPLAGALITACTPNANQNGYTLVYTLAGITDSVVYSWDASGHYTFKFYTASGVSTSNYNGFVPCKMPFATALTEPLLTSTVFIYPNPASHQLFVNYPSQPIEGFREISLLDAQGRRVYASPILQKEIDISRLSAGIYFFCLEATTPLIQRFQVR